MTPNGIFQLALYVVVLIVLARPLGAYMARVYEGRPFGLDRALGWLERLIYRAAGVHPDQEMGWKTYAAAMLVFNLAGLLAVYGLQRLQGILPLNPQGLGAVSPDSSFNTAVSFATQHELAGLWRRDDDELSHADARPHRPELRLGGGGHGGRGRAHPGLRPPLGPDDRQLLGRSHPDAPSTSCCRCRSSWRWCWSPRAWCRRSVRMPRSRSSSPASTTSRSPTRTASRSSTTRASPRPRKPR